MLSNIGFQLDNDMLAGFRARDALLDVEVMRRADDGDVDARMLEHPAEVVERPAIRQAMFGGLRPGALRVPAANGDHLGPWVLPESFDVFVGNPSGPDNCRA
jgi:hypothetical protein